MNAYQDPQRKAFEFLLKKFHSQELFTREEFQRATGWAAGTFKTYWSKQFKGLFVPVGNAFRIHWVFAQYTSWLKFRDNVVTQNRKLSKDYKPLSFKNVIIFEFFMPLRNEEYLRTALDALFFRDSVITRLKSVEEDLLHREFPKLEAEVKEKYFERLCDWISDRFVGYSIHHVGGRFRIGALKTQAQVARIQAETAERYLVDETTAVVRFIIPCGAPSASPFDAVTGNSEQLELKAGPDSKRASRESEEESRIRWFFGKLFVQRIIEVVAGEDEIWLLESGIRNELHIWRVLA